MLRKCVALLRWSDERLKKIPELLAMWRWDRTIREGMTIYFSTTWLDKDFFEARQHAFMERGHISYYAKFGATPNDLKTRHEILGA